MAVDDIGLLTTTVSYAVCAWLRVSVPGWEMDTPSLCLGTVQSARHKTVGRVAARVMTVAAGVGGQSEIGEVRVVEDVAAAAVVAASAVRCLDSAVI